MSAYTMDQIKVKVVTETKMSKAGALLSCGTPRYEDLDSYVMQLGAPLSRLPGAGLVSFSDPIIPELVILLTCEDVDWCGRCDKSLNDCACPF